MKYVCLLAMLMVLASCDEKPAGKPDPQTTPATDSLSSDPEISRLTDLILESPENDALYLERASAYRGKAAFGPAIQDVNRALRIDSMNTAAYNLKATLYLDQAVFDKAYENYQKCVELNGEDVDCLLGQAEMELLLGQYGNAIGLINTALRVDEYRPRAYWLKGRYHKETGDTTLARSSYLTATEIDPDFTDAWIQLGLLWAEERPEFAEAYYKSALETDASSTDALYNLGLLIQEQSGGNEVRLREAIRFYQQLAEAAPIDSRPHFNQGYIQLEYFQQYDSAEIHFTDAIDRYALYFQAFYNRGLCRESLDDPQGALQDYEQALIIQPDYTPAALAKSRVLGE